MPVFAGRVPSESSAVFHALECGYLLKYQKWEFRCSQIAKPLPATKLSAISYQLKAKHDTDFTDGTDHTKRIRRDSCRLSAFGAQLKTKLDRDRKDHAKADAAKRFPSILSFVLNDPRRPSTGVASHQ
jgi:hypothetical protein